MGTAFTVVLGIAGGTFAGCGVWPGPGGLHADAATAASLLQTLPARSWPGNIIGAVDLLAWHLERTAKAKSDPSLPCPVHCLQPQQLLRQISHRQQCND